MNYENYKELADKLNNANYNFCEEELSCVEQLIEDELLNKDYSIVQNEDEELFFSADFLANYFDNSTSLTELNAQYRENQTRFSLDDFDSVIATVVDTLVDNFNVETNSLTCSARRQILTTIVQNSYDFDEVLDRASYYIENFEQMQHEINNMRAQLMQDA